MTAIVETAPSFQAARSAWKAIRPRTPLPAPVGVEDALVALAVEPDLSDSDAQRRLGELVPHLHPTEALDRFLGLRDTCADAKAMVLHARSHRGDDAAALAAQHWGGLVTHRVTALTSKSVAANGDGSAWTCEDTRRLLAGEVAA